MATFDLFRLQPRGAFHFGTSDVDLEESGERCTSDTLYAALVHTAVQTGRPFFVPPEPHDGDAPVAAPLRLSSCFPYAGEVALLPLPRMKLVLDDERGLRKRLKKLAYVSPTIFARIIRGQPLDDYLERHGRLVMNGQVWVASDDGALPEAPFWRVETLPHVAVDRRQQASNYFQLRQVYFNDGCGLYVLAQGNTAGLLDLLRLLGDSGLGGRRSVGLGQFTPVAARPLTLPDAASPQRLLLLSRYRPARDELAGGVLAEGASYDLVQAGGWLQTPHPEQPAQRRRSIRMLAEGSIVHMVAGQPPVGTICDVRPIPQTGSFPHPVWRAGLALGVGIGA